MTPTRSTGWTFSPVASNVVDLGIAFELTERRRSVWTLNQHTANARLAEASAALHDWTVPIRPMIGCFGVAPALNQAISTATSGAYGGNMDYPLFAPGTKAQFPVFASGAPLDLGDGHASQGDGEMWGMGSRPHSKSSSPYAFSKAEERPAGAAKPRMRSLPWETRARWTRRCNMRRAKCCTGFRLTLAWTLSTPRTSSDSTYASTSQMSSIRHTRWLADFQTRRLHFANRVRDLQACSRA